MPGKSNPWDDIPKPLTLDESIEKVRLDGSSSPAQYVADLPLMIGDTILNRHLLYMSRLVTADFQGTEPGCGLTSECHTFIRGARVGMAVLRNSCGSAATEQLALNGIVPGSKVPPKYPLSPSTLSWVAHNSYFFVPHDLRSLVRDWSPSLLPPMSTSDDERLVDAGLGVAWYYIEQTEPETFWLAQADRMITAKEEVADWDGELRRMSPPPTE